MILDCDIIGSNCSYDTFLVSNDKSKVNSGWVRVEYVESLARQDLIQLDSTQILIEENHGVQTSVQISFDDYQIILLHRSSVFLTHAFILFIEF